jgi:hypothetical protein
MKCYYSIRIVRRLLLALAISSIAFGECPDDGSDKRKRPSPGYGQLPLAFEANRGQAAAPVQFLSRGSGYCLFLSSTEATLVLHRTPITKEPMPMQPARPEKSSGQVLRLKFAGTKATPEVAGTEQLPGKANYFIGNDPSQWHRDIPTYAKVVYRGVYPGVDLVYHGDHGQLEYDLIVAPGSDPRILAVDIEGVKDAGLSPQGDLLLTTESGPLVMRKPRLYQDINGKQKVIDGGYTLRTPHQISFSVGEYDTTKPLIIDPVLVYSTFLGGGIGDGITVDGAGNAYVIGTTPLGTFFTTPGASQPVSLGYDAFVVKVNPAGDAAIYSTYLGGSAEDSGRGIAVDGDGNVYLTGSTTSYDFPTKNPYQPVFGGDYDDAFVTKLNCRGNDLVYSTYLGTIGYDGGNGIAVDSSGCAYVTGYTYYHTFPLVNPAQSGFHGMDAFVTKFSPTGDTLIYSTFLGGKTYDYGYGIALDAAGNAYVTGWTRSDDFPTLNPAQATYGGADGDAFVTKLNAAGDHFIYSTFLGGSGNDFGFGIAVDGSGTAYITGYTQSTDFPVANATQYSYGGAPFDAFVTKVDPAGNSFAYSTYLGGSDGDIATGIAVDHKGNAYITGDTYSPDFPTLNPLQSALAGEHDAFVTKLFPTGVLAFSTYFGGGMTDKSNAIAVHDSAIYITGETDSSDFPLLHPYRTTNQGWGDGFVAKISIPQFTSPCCGQIVIGGVVAGAVAILFISLRQRRLRSRSN